MPKRKQETDDVPQQKRAKRKVKIPIEKSKDYFYGPKYNLRDRNSGGSRSHAILGPLCLREMGTDANANKPPGIKKAREKYPKANGT